MKNVRWTGDGRGPLERIRDDGFRSANLFGVINCPGRYRGMFIQVELTYYPFHTTDTKWEFTVRVFSEACGWIKLAACEKGCSTPDMRTNFERLDELLGDSGIVNDNVSG